MESLDYRYIDVHNVDLITWVWGDLRLGDTVNYANCDRSTTCALQLFFDFIWGGKYVNGRVTFDSSSSHNLRLYTVQMVRTDRPELGRLDLLMIFGDISMPIVSP